MLLCFDVGNTHILGGVFDNDRLVARFRYASHLVGTADQFGIFLTSILRANHITPEKITAVAICSVVPGYDYTIRHTVAAYFNASYFMLHAKVKTGLTIQYNNPTEVGADRIANAIGAVAAYPNKNMIIIDMGTATTLCAVTKNRDYLGGAILPGLRVSMESLNSRTAKLMEVEIEKPKSYIGRTTKESIQSGLYYAHLGALQALIAGFKQEAFPNEAVWVVGTGGFAQLYKDKLLFDVINSDLVLNGLRLAYGYSLAS